MSNEIVLEKRDSIAIVTLNRPHAMNALNAALRTALSEAMISIQCDDSVRAVVLTGAGERAFTAGLDLKELGIDNSRLLAATDPDPRSNPVKAIVACGKPVIGAINGVAVTGGFEVALACDILIASQNARFADTHALVGLMPGWGLSQKLSRIIGVSRAKELSFTGRFLDAETALQWGLVNHVVPPETLLSTALELAEKIVAVDPNFIGAYSKLIEDGYSMPYAAALEHERLFSTVHNASVSAVEIEQRRHGVLARGRTQI